MFGDGLTDAPGCWTLLSPSLTDLWSRSTQTLWSSLSLSLSLSLSASQLVHTPRLSGGRRRRRRRDGRRGKHRVDRFGSREPSENPVGTSTSLLGGSLRWSGRGVQPGQTGFSLFYAALLVQLCFKSRSRQVDKRENLWSCEYPPS